MTQCTQARRRAVPKGLQFMVLAAFFFSVMTLLVKFAGNRLPTTELVMARSVVGVVMGYWMLRAARIGLWGQRRGLLIFRGLAGTGALLCFFWALARLPLAEATVLFYTSPIFTAVLAAIFLRESLRLLEIVGIVISLLALRLWRSPSSCLVVLRTGTT